MSFIGSMFSNSNGSGYNAAQGQSSGLTADQTAAAAKNGGVATPVSSNNSGIPNSAAFQGGLSASSVPTIGDQSAAAAAGLGSANSLLQNEATNGSALAQNQLTAATGQNIQQATGQIASTKGLNPALAARLAAQNATSANQQAGNQSAQLQAQTQLAAQGQLSNNLLGQQQIYQNAIANQNNNQTAIAQGNQKAQQGMLGGLENGIGGFLGLAEGGEVDSNQLATPALPSSAIAVPASGPLSSFGKFLKGMQSNKIMSNDNSKSAQGQNDNPIMTGTSNLLSGANKAMNRPPNGAPIAIPQPGALPEAPVAAPMADGGPIAPDDMGKSSAPIADGMDKDKGQSGGISKLVGMLALAKGGNVEERKHKIAQILAAHQKKNQASGTMGMISGSQALAPQANQFYAKGGKVPVMLSPGERALSPKDAKAVAEGKKDAMKAGKKVPGKPVVGGAKNSYANDIVPDKLAEGSIVIPRSVTQSKDPQMAAHAFVAAHYARKGHLVGKKKAK